MNSTDYTEKTVIAMKKWGKPGNNSWQNWMSHLEIDAEKNKQQIAGILFSNLMTIINEQGCCMEFDGFRIKKVQVKIGEEYFMMKPIVQNNRLVFHSNKLGYIDGARIFGEKLNLY